MTKRGIDTLISMIDVYNQQIATCDDLQRIVKLQKERSSFIVSVFNYIKKHK